MNFSLSKSGTTDEVRSALYDAERAADPQNQEEKLAVRAIGHAIAVQIDAREVSYNAQVNVTKAALPDAEQQKIGLAAIAKPQISVSASFSLTVS